MLSVKELIQSVHSVSDQCPGCKRRQELMQQLAQLVDTQRLRIKQLERKAPVAIDTKPAERLAG